MNTATTARLISMALEEDVGEGDWTTLWTVPADRSAHARIVARGEGVIAGLPVVQGVFRHIDPEVEVRISLRDGERVAAGQEVGTLEGSARSILTGERVALNFLQRLSGIATLTRAFVDAVDGTGATILDTRKTTPGLRSIEKQAVVAGGGANHRFGLHDMILIKENHIRAAGGIGAAVEAVHARNDRGLRVEVEVTNPAETEEALLAGVDRILFDNMSVPELADAVGRVRAHDPAPESEASGGIELRTVRAVAETGVDFISVGWLTHSAHALDLSLLVDR